MDVEGKVLRRREVAVTLAASGVTSIGDFRDAELLAGADPKRTVAVFELLQNGAVERGRWSDSSKPGPDVAAAEAQGHVVHRRRPLSTTAGKRGLRARRGLIRCWMCA